MPLRLSIENVDRLPAGAPPQIDVNGRGLALGRDEHLDWTLPDGSRIISGKHCEIRFEEGGYWLHDVSTNGTFVNGSPRRLNAPYLLRDGDRLNIGPYIIAVSVQGGQEAGRTTAPASSTPAPGEWEMFGRAAPPGDRAGRLEAGAQRTEVARAATVERQPGQRTRHVGDAFQARPHCLAQPGFGAEE